MEHHLVAHWDVQWVVSKVKQTVGHSVDYLDWMTVYPMVLMWVA